MPPRLSALRRGS